MINIIHNIKKGEFVIDRGKDAERDTIRTFVGQRLLLGDTALPKAIIEQVCDGLQDPNYNTVIEGVNARDTLLTFNELHEKLLVRENHLTTTKT